MNMDRRVRIVAIGKQDAWYPDRKELVGKTGVLSGLGRQSLGRGWFSSWFHPDDEPPTKVGYYFAWVKVAFEER